MIYTEDVQITEKRIKALQCNCCNTMIFPDNMLEWNEFVSWKFTGGYASVWGDGNTIKIDLCQHCFYNLLHKYAEDISE